MSEEHDYTHGDLLALDPGVRSPGLALFRHGVLTATTRLKIPEELHALPNGVRWLRIALLAREWWVEQQLGIKRTVRTFVYEHPQWYSEREKKTKGDPNKLAHVLGVGQSLAVLIAMQNIHEGTRPPEILNPTPHEWTGNVPKTVNGKLPKDPRKSPRHGRLWGLLTPGERAICLARNEAGELTNTLLREVNNDAFDGIGIGLFALKRYSLNGGRVFAGATR